MGSSKNKQIVATLEIGDTVKIIDVKTIKPLHLFATFEDGSVKIYDVNIAIKRHEDFIDLITIPHLFEQVQVDCGGAGVSWNDYIDLASEEIYQNGIPIEKAEEYLINAIHAKI